MSDTDQNVNPEDINPQIDEPKVEDVATIDEPVDNSSRSRLGRKVAHLEDNITQFMQEMRELVTPLKEGYAKPKDTFGEDPLSLGDDTDEIVTAATLRKELDNYYKRQKEVEEAQARKFKNEYTKTLLNLSSDLSEEEFSSIISELDAMGNPKSSDDPTIAAKLNFLSVKTKILENKIKAPKNPIKNVEHAPTGIGGASTVKQSDFKMPELTEEELDFIRRTGMSEEDVKDALSNRSGTLVMK